MVYVTSNEVRRRLLPSSSTAMISTADVPIPTLIASAYSKMSSFASTSLFVMAPARTNEPLIIDVSVDVGAVDSDGLGAGY